jgi:hypothetical protein
VHRPGGHSFSAPPDLRHAAAARPIGLEPCLQLGAEELPSGKPHPIV